MAKVSILVPIYNVERYLRDCLDSLINQTLEDIEIICINDGSTDSSLKIIQEFASKDKRIKIIDKKNSGYGASMNKGLELASGEFIGILESDDFADIKMYETLYNEAKKHNAEIVVSDFYYYWTNPKKTKKANRTSKYKLNQIINIKTLPSLLRNRTTIWSCIYKKDLLEKYDIRFLETPGASYQDTSFRMKTLAAAKKVTALSSAFVYYRQDNVNSSVKSKGKVFIICDEYKETFKFLNKYPKLKKISIDEVLINKWHGYTWNLGRIDEEFVDEFLNLFQEEFQKHFENEELNEYFYKYIGKSKVKKLLEKKESFKKYVRELKGKNILQKSKLKIKMWLKA